MAAALRPGPPGAQHAPRPHPLLGGGAPGRERRGKRREGDEGKVREKGRQRVGHREASE